MLIGLHSNIEINQAISLLDKEGKNKINYLIEFDPITIKKLENFVFDSKLQYKIQEIIEAWYLKVLQVNFYDSIVDLKTNKDVLEIEEVFTRMMDNHDDMELHEDLNEDTNLIKKDIPKKKTKIKLPKLPKFDEFKTKEETKKLLAV